MKDIVFRMFCDILKLDDFDHSLSFFELGGQSILLSKLKKKIKSELNIDISFAKLFELNTVDTLAEYLTEHLPDNKSDEQIENEKYNYPVFYRNEFPLLDMQKAYYVGRNENISLGGMPTHAYSEITCRHLDIERLKTAVNKLIENYDSLQLEFNGGVQKIAEILPVLEIPFNNISEWNRNDKEYYLQKRRDAIFEIVFDIKKAPLIYFEATKISENDYVIHFAHDGLIIDGWSHENLIYTLEQLYLGEKPASAMSFYNYSLHIGKLKGSAIYEADKQFWLEALKDFPDAPMLQIKDNEPDLKIEQIIRVISKETYDGIKRFALKHSVTSFSVFLTAFGKSLERYCRNTDYLINIPIAVRPTEFEGVENTIGECSNFFFFPFRNKKNELLLNTIKRVNDELLNFMDHLSFMGTDLIRESQKVYGSSVSAPIVFTSTLDVAEHEYRVFNKSYSKTHTSQVWVDAIVMPCRNDVLFSMDCAKNILYSSMMNEIADIFVSALSSIVSDEMYCLKKRALPLSPNSEKMYQQLNAESYPSKVNELISVSEQIQRSMDIYSDKTAIITSNKRITYSELKSLCHKYYFLFREVYKLKPHESRIGIYLEKGWEQIVIAVAAVCSAIGYMPIEYAFPTESVAECTRNAGLDYVITDGKNAEKLSSAGIPVINIENVDFSKLSESTEFISAEMQEVMIIINTSGTTGFPKCVSLYHYSIANCLANTVEYFGITPNDCAIALTNFCHDMAIFDTLGMFVTGGSVAIPDSSLQKDPDHWKTLIRDMGVTIWNSVPTFMKMFTASCGSEETYTNIKHIWHGGEMLTPKLAADIIRIFPEAELINVGGPTETTVWSIYHKVTKKDIDSGTIPYGKPFPGTKYLILNDNLLKCPVGVTGMMYIGGRGLAKCYENAPEETARNFIYLDGERLYRTGDLGKYRSDGSILIIGRDDSQVKINGKRIELSGIEKIAMSHSQVKDACAVLNNNNSKITLFYTISGDMDEKELYSYMAEYLPDYMIPASLCRLDCFPVTRNGKTDKNELKKQAEKLAAESDITSDENETINALINICRDILGTVFPSDDLNFYVMGGDSISSLLVIQKIREKFGVDLSITELLQQPSLYEWASVISSRMNAKKNSPDDILKMENMRLFGSIEPNENSLYDLDDPITEAKKVAEHLSRALGCEISAYDLLSRPYADDWNDLCKKMKEVI